MTMPLQLQLPDQILETADPIDGFALAKQLAVKALAWTVNGQQRDLSFRLTHSANVALITRDQPEGLEILRHDAAHVLAEAVKELFPETQVTIGPAIEDGFYYDFYRETSFSPDDLLTIEARMREIVKRDEKITREEWDRDQAVAFFKEMGEHYKAEIIASIPDDQPISLYRQGNFIDLCRGPHLPSTRHLGTAFKLTKLAGAYWRGDSNNVMLQRIYGTAWANEDQLAAYLHRLEEAEKRDHRKLGRELELFHLQEEAVGSVFWHPNGWKLWQTLENFIRSKLRLHDYQEIKTPQLYDSSLFKASGHWDMYGDNMFKVEVAGEEGRVLGIKPMSCPGHIQVFKQGMKSYRDLPLRLTEFGSCHRLEPSGAIHGIMRLRAFTQDDAHIFCRPDQITEESKRYCLLQFEVFHELGFNNIDVKLATRPDKRLGSEETWDTAEQSLRRALQDLDIQFVELPGEGAFYGPKIEFHLTDSIGRSWQCGTLQLDFVLPERLDASYIDEQGLKQRPAMLHRALLGSMERFIGIMIEHYAGAFPTWLAPIQARVIPIADRHNAYAEQVRQTLFDAPIVTGTGGLRVDVDDSTERMQKKIRNAQLAKIPYVLVVGDAEAAAGTVAVRLRGGQDLGSMPLDQLLARLTQEVQSRQDVAQDTNLNQTLTPQPQP
jgi:threonyl-tRNA synthetase